MVAMDLDRDSEYARLGVDVRKKGIEAFKEVTDNLFPNAFCVVTRDPQNPGRGVVLHTDGAGSKPIQSYTHWRETGMVEAFKGLAQDVLAMNLDDILCVGAKPISFVDYIALNSFRLPREEVLKSISQGFKEALEALRREEVTLSFSGGETADLPDQVGTLDISATIYGSVDLEEVIDGSRIKEGDLILGLRSGGRCRYEEGWNSGIMCNGITLARHCLLRREYQERYPEISHPRGKGYYGRYAIDDYLEELGMTVGEAILSPTRIYTPILVKLIEKFGGSISALIHNTGSGQTKCLRVGRNIHYIKDDLLEPDPIFPLIQREAGESWRAMYTIYNMGVGFEVIIDREVAEEALDVVESYGVEAKIIGRCEEGRGRNTLTIKTPHGTFHYTL